MMSIPEQSFAVQASSHQGSPLFTSPGRQCMFNAIASCLMNDILPVQTWNREVLDRILSNGDRMCSNSCLRDIFPRIVDMDKHFLLDGKYFQVNVGDSQCGSIFDTEEPFLSIEQAFENATKYSVLTVGSCTPAYSSGIIRTGRDFYVFDPHSRDQFGMATPGGRATLTKHTLEEMTQFLKHMSASLFAHGQFELTSIYITCLSSFTERKHSGMESDTVVLCEECDNVESSDSDTDSDDIPLGSIKTLRTQVDHKRNRMKNTKKNIGHPEYPETRSRESKQKARILMKELMTVVCPSPAERYGHISDSDGDNDESYLPPPPKKNKSSQDASMDSSNSDTDDPSMHPEQAHDDTIMSIRPSDCSGSPDNNDSVIPTESSFLESSQVSSAAGIASADLHNIRGRRRQRDPDNWVYNIAKRKRNNGEEYKTRKGKMIKAREMKNGCGVKCRLRCHQKISSDQRKSIFNGYWQMGCLLRQRDFLSKNVIEEKRRRIQNQGESRRSRSIKWHLEVNSEKFQVCKTFFLHTLDISDTVVYTTIRKTNGEGIVQPERRGKFIARPNEKGEEKEIVRAHIDSYPRTESHYCRKETKRIYLDGDLSLQKMYAMYKTERTNANKTPVSESTYKQIFYTEYNLGFFRRSKDRCDFCVSYKNEQNREENSDLKKEFEKHHTMKNQARDLKDIDKRRAKSEKEFSAATFDLEDVLVTPKGSAKGFYYKRRLNTYNLSIYDYGSDVGINNIWNERTAKRGSNEIGSCVYKYVLSEIEKGKTTFSFFSDACGGQNRNKHMVALFWWIRSVHGLKEIKHTFFCQRPQPE